MGRSSVVWRARQLREVNLAVVLMEEDVDGGWNNNDDEGPLTQGTRQLDK